MKRSPLKRRTPLKRSPMKRGRKKQRPLAERKADPTSDYWLKKCDELWSKLVRSSGCCAKCGKEGKTEAHHLITRARKHLRHLLINGVELCYRCHQRGEGSAHEDITGFRMWLEAERPDQAEWVEDHKNRTYRGKPDYRAKYEELKEMMH